MLQSLSLHHVGPVPNLSATLGSRLNILTGDNGLGKSFLLDVCFWTLTGIWPGGRIALPEANGKKIEPKIIYEVQGKSKKAKQNSKHATFDFGSQTWNRPPGRPFMPGLVVYAAIDGSFAVWDPARNYWRDPATGIKQGEEQPKAYQLTAETLADGLVEGKQQLCNGLIRDWVEWYLNRKNNPKTNPFEYLESVISALSHPCEPLLCDEPQKVFSNDSRRFPTLKMPYGTVSYPKWSAGIKRIVHLAYLLVWAWTEHQQAALLRNESPTDRIVLIVDEIESHLHPKWQRTILPALLQVVQKLQSDISTQIFATTHSPLVLASLESHFDMEVDQVFRFNLHEKSISLENPTWATQGDVVAWLTSDYFGLDQARSREAEEAIEAAEAFVRKDAHRIRPHLDTREKITARLQEVLPGLDPFWPRWIVEGQ